MEEPNGAARADKPAFVWVSAGLLLNAALITTVGFILSCTLCYVLAVQGLRRAAGQDARHSAWAVDGVTGLLISAPVYWTSRSSWRSTCQGSRKPGGCDGHL
jgi:putative tricarboxylic transport membrane protein